MYRFLCWQLSIPFLAVLFAVHTHAWGQEPMLEWPLEPVLGDRTFLLNYVDDDPAQGSLTDFTCRGQYLYDGHTGTDISANNFRLMDEGVPIVAAADGQVTWVRYDQFDRNYWPPYQGQPNGIIIRHSGGIDTQYWHNRQNSAAVVVGETVKKGQVIAMVGSSGATPIPHIHFEVRDNGTVRDPFSGPCNARPSMWDATYTHPSDTLLRILDWDIFTKTGLSGNEANNYFGETALKDRPFRPDVFGVTEPTLGIWVQLQGAPGAVYTLRIISPDGSIRSEIFKGVSTAKSVQWHAHYRDFTALTAGLEEIDGLWRIELEFDGSVRHERIFEVGSETEYAPRFHPLAGKSIRWSGIEIREQLQLSGREGPATFRIPNRSTGVRIEGTDIVFSSAFEPVTRNSFVSVVAEDAEGRADKMRFHIVDLGRPFTSTGVGTVMPKAIGSRRHLGAAYPNPAQKTSVIPFSLDRSGPVRLSLIDIQGRLLSRIVDSWLQSGQHERDVDLRLLPAGVYVIRLDTGGRVEHSFITKTG